MRIILISLFISLSFILKAQTNSIDSIYVDKSDRKMMLYKKKEIVKTYIISIGQVPIGHKRIEGDLKTPEGLYTISDKNPHSQYYLNLGISYPNNADRKRARALGKSPGGAIKIHGYSDRYGSTKARDSRYVYTWGCIALTNNDMKEVYDWVKVGAKIMIVP